MQFDDVKDEVNNSIEQMLDNGGFLIATGEQIAAVRKRLDPRAVPSRMYYNDAVLVVPSGSQLRVLNYYGGFEYVQKDCVYTAGDFVFFSAEDGRVADVLEVLNDNEG